MVGFCKLSSCSTFFHIFILMQLLKYTSCEFQCFYQNATSYVNDVSAVLFNYNHPDKID